MPAFQTALSKLTYKNSRSTHCLALIILKASGNQPEGFSRMSKAVVELIDSTAGGLSGDFTGEQLACFKPKRKNRRFYTF